MQSNTLLQSTLLRYMSSSPSHICSYPTAIDTSQAPSWCTDKCLLISLAHSPRVVDHPASQSTGMRACERAGTVDLRREIELSILNYGRRRDCLFSHQGYTNRSLAVSTSKAKMESQNSKGSFPYSSSEYPGKFTAGPSLKLKGAL
jgi:hypothetical protein